MKRVPQFRLRTLMVVVVIVALSLTTLIQSVRVQNLSAQLQEQRAREEVARIQALRAEAQARATAEQYSVQGLSRLAPVPPTAAPETETQSTTDSKEPSK